MGTGRAPEAFFCKRNMILKRQRTVGIIPAAGLGLRMGGNRPKQFLEIHGTPILALTLKAFQDCTAVDRIVVVTPEREIEHCRRDIVDRYHLHKVMEVVPGGERRLDSVRLGFEAAGTDFPLVVIHDGVRPLVDRELIEKVVRAAEDSGAAVAGVPARETVKEADTSARVIRTLDRSRIWFIQTPQAFASDILREAHKRARSEGWPDATDDAALVEKLGIPVTIVHGSEKNIKLTTPFDLALARFLLEHDTDQGG